MSLLNWLDHIDKMLVLLIQHDSDHFLLDMVMPVLRDPYTWIPLYAFMLYYAIRKGRKKVWFFIVLSVLTFAITDSVTTQLLKPLFGRLRPCCDPELHSMVRMIVDCGGIYSMPSSHAANHFGLAAFWYFTILTMTGRKWKWLWVWAAVICYAQIYVGKHYPSDILFGSLFGYITGMGMSRLFDYWWHRQIERVVVLSLGN
jgi:membrane-associated phospholipid phosphatase